MKKHNISEDELGIGTSGKVSKTERSGSSVSTPFDHIGKLWSLWDMLKFKGETFFRLSQLLTVLITMHEGTITGVKMALDAFPGATDGKSIRYDKLDAAELPDDDREALKITIEQYRTHLEAARLRISLKSFDRLIEMLSRSPAVLVKLTDQASDLQTRIQDELEDTALWQIPSEQSKYLTLDPWKFAEQNNFADAHRDIEESGKCLAFDRGTACVFHLMRVVECGLRALAKSLNNPDLDPKRNPNWEALLKKCDDELRKPLKERSSEWRQDDAFFSTATANLRAVKDAWRNPSLHVERDYTPEEAEDVWNAVRALMRHLTQRLGLTASSN